MVGVLCFAAADRSLVHLLADEPGSAQTYRYRYTHHNWAQTVATLAYFPANYNSDNGDAYYNWMLQPLAGEVTQVDIYCNSNPGSTDIVVYRKPIDGSTVVTLDSDTIVMAATTMASFTFTTATFSAQEFITLSCDPTNVPNDTRAVVHWKLTPP